LWSITTPCTFAAFARSSTLAPGTLQTRHSMRAREPGTCSASTSAWKFEPLPDASTPTRSTSSDFITE
jgi:hypothetical protein